MTELVLVKTPGGALVPADEEARAHEEIVSSIESAEAKEVGAK